MGVDLPGSATVFLTTEHLEWSARLYDPDNLHRRWDLYTAMRRAQPGESYQLRMNRAVFGPNLYRFEGREGGWRRPWADRNGDRISPGLPMYGADGPGFSHVDVAWTQLYRNGTLHTESRAMGGLVADVPGGDAAYTLVARAGRGRYFFDSNIIRTTWTFRSSTTAVRTPLPLWAASITGVVDERNLAPGGRQRPRMHLHHEAGAPVGALTDVDATFSVDEGQTWQAANPAPAGEPGVFDLDYTVPTSSPGTVSLRVRASDARGNTVDQTTVRAYRYGVEATEQSEPGAP